jgi:hypothetical protein
MENASTSVTLRCLNAWVDGVPVTQTGATLLAKPDSKPALISQMELIGIIQAESHTSRTVTSRAVGDQDDRVQ